MKQIITTKDQNANLLTKDELALRVLQFYFESGRIPTHRDFKYSSTYRRRFGNWSNTLKYCGLDLLTQKIESTNANTWERQKKRHFDLKVKYVTNLGGKCEICGYNQNLACLVFHHKDPNKKEIALDARSLGNRSESKIIEELKNCSLLCHNCHTNLHNPDLRDWNP